MPRPVLAVTFMLCCVAAVLGVWAGIRPAITETQVIEAGAGLYAEETGGSRADCVGIPGEGRVWIVVRCGASGKVRTYLFDRGGTLIVPEDVRT
ncbi:hypothetical protein [Silicimonas sp. MF1-12-2]|uniref:hypothetical protein n=1 Tax=Silicimonas sp. MF1-12-2 TaxID=3384793 RepID=UPI0039B4FCF7